MCGICGLLFLDKNRRLDRSVIIQMMDRMIHRGPDDSGLYLDGSCAFGHRRLSIIDIATGQQPITRDDDGNSLTIVFNGEIYNYLELRNELKKLGYHFVTKSDTEIILIAYREWGESCPERLRGMFSFAIWDKRSQRLFLVRDRMGIKPLYYYHNNSVFIFASEIKALLASNIITREVETSALDAFLTLGYVPAPLTLFKGILKLLPGHTMSVDANGEFQTKCYWNFSHQGIKKISFEQAQEELEQLLKDSVKMRLMSEVPLGVFLSGGLDSSAVLALMSKVTDQPIKTFSVGYEEADEANELDFARKVAQQFKTEHHEFFLKPYDFFEFIPELVEYTEEPLVETAAIPLYQISKKAKEFATVILSGEGGDEIFAGYGLYRRMLRIKKYRFLFKPLKLIPGDLLIGDKFKKYFDWVSHPLSISYRGTSADVTESVKKDFYSPDFLSYTRKNNYLDKVFSRYFKDVHGKDPLSQLLYVDSKTWLPDDLLLKADKMTMATAVELRVPFLDHKVVEFAASLPSHFKLNGHTGKFILKKLMEDSLSHDIIYRRKMGFTVPTRRWFAGELSGPAKEILCSNAFLAKGYFRKEYIESIFNRHRRGKEDYSRRIFSLLVLYHWFNIFTK